MKGLLIKDLELIWHNKKMFVIMLVVMLLVFQNYNGYSFIIGYNTMIFMLLVLNTMTLDEDNKSIAHLMTLPVKRKTYVLEKYVLMSGFSLAGAVLTTLFCILLHRETALVILMEALGIYIIMLLLQLLMIPVQLKFGGEKGRVVLIGLLACVTVVATSLVRELPGIFGIQGKLGEVLNDIYTWFVSLGKAALAIVACLILVVCMAVSYLVSRRIMCRREF